MKFLDPVVLGGTMSSMKKGDNIDDDRGEDGNKAGLNKLTVFIKLK